MAGFFKGLIRTIFGASMNEEILARQKKDLEQVDTFIASKRQEFERNRGQLILPIEQLNDPLYGSGSLLQHAVLADGLVFHDGREAIRIPHYHQNDSSGRNLSERVSALGTFTPPREGVITMCDGKGRMYFLPEEITRKSDGIRLPTTTILSAMGLAQASWFTPMASSDIPIGRMSKWGFSGMLPVSHNDHKEVQEKLRRGPLFSVNQLKGFVERIRDADVHKANDHYWDPSKRPTGYR